jgi:hypothetical protein
MMDVFFNSHAKAASPHSHPVRSMALLMGLLLAGGLVTGCASSRGHKLSWRTLSRGLTSGIVTPQKIVIRDEAEYFTLWAEHAADLNRVALPPDVDFSREMVVLVAMGTKPTGGYYIEVVDMELRARTLHVMVGERVPRPGTMQVQVQTQPYQLVALPFVNARVRFHTVHEEDGRPARRRARPGVEGSLLRSRTPAPAEPMQSPRGAERP